YLYETVWIRIRATGQSRRTEQYMQARESRSHHFWSSAQEITSHTLAWIGRQDETDNDLIVATVKREILTSEHTAALIHAATNICAIDDNEILRLFLADVDFLEKLHELFSTFRVSALNLPTQLRTVPDAAAKAIAATILHLALSVGTIMDLAPPKDRALVIFPPLRPMLPNHLIWYFWKLATMTQLEHDLWDDDLKDVNILRFLGILLRKLFQDCIHLHDWEHIEGAFDILSNFTTSHQLLCSLSCVAKVYFLLRHSNPPTEDVDRHERLSQLFEIFKTIYDA
ncbi:hypothetical protein FS837_001738, partial [Tulasnella sp. UAMH 9824]